MTTASKAHTTWAESFLTAADTLPGKGTRALTAFREKGLHLFFELGLPTKRMEDWRYSDLRNLATSRWHVPARRTPPAGEVETALGRLPGGAGFFRLVFLDGRLVRPLCQLAGLPAGVTIESIATVAETRGEWLAEHLGTVVPSEENGCTALNSALFMDGYVLHLADGIELNRPLEVIFLTTTEAQAAAMHFRNLVIAEPSSKASVVEVFVGPATSAYWVHSITEMIVKEKADLTHVRLQEDGHQSFHLNRTGVHQHGHSKVASHVISTGARQSRQDLSFVLAEEESECSLQGLFVMNGQQKADHQTLVDHRVPHTRSDELYKGALDGASEGSFTGRVLVRKNAQHVEAGQQNRNLLLSDLARVNTRPQLEIYADDVKCSHGATSGRLDETALFYLRSRGIPLTRARQLLTRAFVTEVIHSIPVPALKDHLLPLVDDRLCPGHLLEETP
jgi:Fe-S cluster assembly protein SufD